jgi:putative flippase GtrA
MKFSRQIKHFILTGALNTVFGYLVYAGGVVVFDLSYFRAVVASYVIGVSFSYATFRTFVFTAGDRGWRSYPRFILTYIFLFAVNVIALYALVDLMGYNKLLAQALVVPGCAALSFIINQLFVFRRKKDK